MGSRPRAAPHTRSSTTSRPSSRSRCWGHGPLPAPGSRSVRSGDRSPMPETARATAHAKVNLLLRVLAREADGFHGIETLFCRISLADELTVERTAAGITLETDATDLGPAERNLAVLAAEQVLAATGRRFGVRIALSKRIPVGAGLGGGSSDAAATLLAVNALAGNAIPRHELLQLAARLGSDVPFLVSGAPLAIAWAHGDRMMRLPPLPA